MIPARSLAPVLFTGGSALAVVWIYFVGPFIGTFLAVGLYQLNRGSGDYIKDVLEEPPNKAKVMLEKKSIELLLT